MTTTEARRREHLLSDAVAGTLAVASFGSSLRHVQTVAASHGQHGLISWAIAISVELVALVAILELRRARGHGYVPVAAVIALGAGLAMSAGANLATATTPGLGWSQVVAVWPAVAYVLVAVIIETRPDKATAADTTPAAQHDASEATPPHDSRASEDDTATEATNNDTADRATAVPNDKSVMRAPATRLHAVPTPTTPRRATIPSALLESVLDGDLTQSAAAEKAAVSVRTLQRHLDAERARRNEHRPSVDGRSE